MAFDSSSPSLNLLMFAYEGAIVLSTDVWYSITLVFSLTQQHTHTHTRTRTHAHTRTHARTHARTRTHTHTHTHTTHRLVTRPEAHLGSLLVVPGNCLQSYIHALCHSRLMLTPSDNSLLSLSLS